METKREWGGSPVSRRKIETGMPMDRRRQGIEAGYRDLDGPLAVCRFLWITVTWELNWLLVIESD